MPTSKKNCINFFPPFISFLPTAQAAQQAHVQIQASPEALNTAALHQTQTTQMKSLISGRQDVPAPPELPHSTSNLAGVLLDGGRGSPVESTRRLVFKPPWPLWPPKAHSCGGLMLQHQQQAEKAKATARQASATCAMLPRLSSEEEDSEGGSWRDRILQGGQRTRVTARCP